jgi:hypothetical protein
VNLAECAESGWPKVAGVCRTRSQGASLKPSVGRVAHRPSAPNQAAGLGSITLYLVRFLLDTTSDWKQNPANSACEAIGRNRLRLRKRGILCSTCLAGRCNASIQSVRPVAFGCARTPFPMTAAVTAARRCTMSRPRWVRAFGCGRARWEAIGRLAVRASAVWVAGRPGNRFTDGCRDVSAQPLSSFWIALDRIEREGRSGRWGERPLRGLGYRKEKQCRAMTHAPWTQRRRRESIYREAFR